VKLVHLVDFITKKFVTMQGHMNVKNVEKRDRLLFHGYTMKTPSNEKKS